MDKRLEQFETHRPLLFSIAYRMLGTVMEAEDAIQDAYLRYLATDVEAIQSPKAFLSTVITRICLDQLKSARVQREEYVGPWLPEPLLTADGPDELLAQHESISMAFLVLLETLSPVERAVFLLREVFAYEYGEIAQIVEKSEANCRQLYSRARRHIRERRPRFTAKPDEQQRLFGSFINAVSEGNVGAITGLLAEDVQLWSDGGGKAAAATRPLVGCDTVLRFLVGIRNKQPPNTTVSTTEVNGAPALLIYVDGKLVSVCNLVWAEERIREIRFVRNPDKLQRLQTRLCGLGANREQ